MYFSCAAADLLRHRKEIMIRVMLVDDEAVILDGLSSFPWADYGCRVVATAYNGKSALDQISGARPQLIFTDIKMPGMSGLEFAKVVREQNADIKIVFLTGYGTFDFAQQAIQLGASEYLLKPVNPLQLAALVEKLTAQIQREAENKRYLEALERDYSAELPFLREKFVYDLLHGQFYDENDYTVRANSLELPVEKYVCCTLTKTNAEMRTTISEAFGIRNICEEVLLKYCDTVLSEYDLTEQCCNLILLFDRTQTDAFCVSRALEGCEKLRHVFDQIVLRSMDIGISSAGSDPLKLYEKFYEAIKANGQSTYLGGHAIVKFEDLENVSPLFDLDIPNARKVRLFRHVYAANTLLVEQDIQRIFSESLQLENAKFLALDLLIDCMKYPSLCQIDRNFNGEHFNYSFLQDSILVVSKASSVRKISEYLIRMFGLLAKQVNHSADDRYSAAVTNIVDYIEANYARDLSLDSVADHFNISRSYLSRMLKKYTGKTFLSILVDARMHAAREMILENRYKINEIAEKVGYNDFSYFVQAFKKHYGITPNEYRKSI